MKALYRLPVYRDHIQYERFCMCYNSVTSSTPKYVKELLQTYTKSHFLESVEIHIFIKNFNIKFKRFGSKAFM